MLHRCSALNWIRGNYKGECDVPSLLGKLEGFGTLVCTQLLKSHEGELQYGMDDDCVICLNPLLSLRIEEDVGNHLGEEAKTVNIKNLRENQTYLFRLNLCKHMFHLDCGKRIFANNVSDGYYECPICKTINGTRIGTQPPDGTMNIIREWYKLPGFENNSSGTIVVTYHFSDGIQGQRHPNPGQLYSAASFPRITYFPDNEKGQKVVSLMKVAFERRLVFTVGQSITTGKDNVITWNGIHHKTTIHSHSHGYPDSNYLDNVLGDLRAFGIAEDEDIL